MIRSRVLRTVGVLCTLALPVFTSTAGAQTLYGAVPGATSSLYVIDPTTGVGTPIGNIGFGITGLAFHPITGELYGTQGGVPGGGPGAFDRNLIRINRTTGAGTIIGPIGLGFGGIADIAFRADGTLFGWSENTDALITINLTTGQGTLVGTDPGISTRGSGLAFNAAGILHLAGNNGNGPLRTVNTATGLTTVGPTLTGAPHPTQPIPAMKFHPVTDVLYAVNRQVAGTGTTFLITINTTNGQVTTIGPTVSRLDGLAWSPLPAAPPPPSVPTAFPPTIGGFSNQLMEQNASLTMPFTIAGAILPTAMRVSFASSNPTLFPSSPSSLSSTCNLQGACTLTIRPADGRAGSAVITGSVFDGFYTTSASFTVSVVAARPSAPGVALANTSGSGIVVTWSPPDTGPPLAYAIAWGTASGMSNLPVQLVLGSETQLVLTSVPQGTYFFRVHGVGTRDLGLPSPEASAVVGASAAPGPPQALQTALAAGGFGAGWQAPLLGAAPTLYEVQIGTLPGLADVASVTTTDLTINQDVGAGSYWTRVRAASGGATGAWSSSVQIPVDAAPCEVPPSAPIMLPVTTPAGQVTFNWIPTGATAATHYQVQISLGAGLPPAGRLNTSGPGSSLVWNFPSGSFAARVVAVSPCVSSPPSNEVTFTITP